MTALVTPNNKPSFIRQESSLGLSQKTQKRGRKEDKAASELHRQRHAVAVYVVMMVKRSSYQLCCRHMETHLAAKKRWDLSHLVKPKCMAEKPLYQREKQKLLCTKTD